MAASAVTHSRTYLRRCSTTPRKTKILTGTGGRPDRRQGWVSSSSTSSISQGSSATTNSSSSSTMATNPPRSKMKLPAIGVLSWSMSTYGVLVIFIIVEVQVFEVTGTSTHLLNGFFFVQFVMPGRRGVNDHGSATATVAAQAIVNTMGGPISIKAI